MTTDHFDAATHPLWHASAPMSYVLGVAGPDELLVGGEGAWLTDAGGRRFLDARAGIGNMMLGYSRRDIVDAMHAQALRLPFACTMRYERPAPVTVDYARALVDTAPAPLTRVRFTHTGSSAVEAAMHMARLYQRNLGRAERAVLVGLDSSFHGTTLMAMAVSGQPGLHGLFGPMPEGFHHVPPAAQGFDAFLASLEAVGPERVAAVVIEPVRGLSAEPAGADYLTRLRAWCSEHDVLLVFDEVFTGIGRTGPMFAAELVGVDPDLMCLSKGLTAGYAALGAVLACDRVYEAFDEPGKPYFAHGSSTDAHPVACAAGLATLEAFEREDVLGQGERTGELLRARLRELLDGCPHVQAVRGMGAFTVVDVVDSAGAKVPMDLLRHLEHACQREGVLVDHTPDVLMMVPPLTITDEDVEVLATTVAEVLGSFDEAGVDPALLRPPSVTGRR